MVTMYKLIKEDNKQVLEMIKQLDQKILQLKKENKIPADYLQPITEFYQEAIVPWMDGYYLLDKEIDPEAEQEVQDKVYELFLLLQALE